MKKFVRVFLLLVILIMTVNAVGCGEDDTITFDSSASVTERLQAVVNVIQRGDRVDVSNLVTGMSEKSFEPVEKAIAAVVKGVNPRNIEITLVESENKYDIDNTQYLYNLFNVTCEDNTVELEVICLEGNEIYMIRVK